MRNPFIPPPIRSIEALRVKPTTAFPRQQTNLLQTKLQEGLTHHQAGRLDLADAAYERVLQINPNQADALRLRAIIYAGQGRQAEATALLESALRAKPNFPEAHYTLGNLLQSTGQVASAIEHYQQAIKQRPNFPEAQCNLGNAFAAEGRHEQAIGAYRAALKGNPNHAEVHNNLSVAYRKTRRIDEALSAAQRALKCRADYADAWNNQGIAQKTLGRLNEAIESYRRAVSLDALFAEGIYNLAQALDESGRPDEALQTYRHALALKPAYAEAYLGLGSALQNLDRFSEARDAYAQCLACDPHRAEALNNIGTTFQKEKRYAEAEDGYRQAVALKPSYHEAWNNLGTALQYQKRWDEALTLFQKALELAPNYADAHNNVGVVLKLKNDLAGAEKALRRAIDLSPKYAEAHNNLANLLLSLCRGDEALAEYRVAAKLNPKLPLVEFNQGAASLLLGKFADGWAKYERRFDTWPAHERRHCNLPRWERGMPLQGKRLLVHAEQGLGDTLQFVRYVPLLAAQGATVFLEVQASLRSLISGVTGAAGVFAQGETLPECDFQCPLLSLPFGFGTEMSTIPASSRYLQAPPERAAAWKSKLGAEGKRKIGVVWAGNPNHENDHNRSVPLGEFAALFDSPGVAFFSLQKQCTATDAEIVSAHGQVTNLAADLTDFNETAAAIEALDVVIAVDTSVAHLAGALGKPVWILLPFSPDWRWLLGRDDSPWYPSARLFRQERTGDWRAPLVRIREALAQL